MSCESVCLLLSFFFFNDTATTEIYTLSLHDALPISVLLLLLLVAPCLNCLEAVKKPPPNNLDIDRKSGSAGMPRPISYAVFCLKKKKKNKKLYKSMTDNIMHVNDDTTALERRISVIF